MNKVEIKKDWCKGCGYCVDVCPKKILQVSNELNSAGFFYTTVTGDGCIGCKSCYTICPDYAITLTMEK